MSVEGVTVALPVLNGGPLLVEVLDAVRRQRVDMPVDLLVCDSGSTDGSVEAARAAGARVIEIPKAEFSHGGTRNLLMREATGSHVAFLTQDATPVDELWLRHLLEGFELADGVALAYGPYLPRSGASPSVARELEEFFASMAPDEHPVLDRATPDGAWRNVSARATFFTDANGAVARRAWETVPFPVVPYAEDRLLARRMLEAGFGKVYVPQAGVVHSHDYRSWDLFRRYFDEFRGLRETFGHVEPLDPRRTLGTLRREGDRRPGVVPPQPSRPDGRSTAIPCGRSATSRSARWAPSSARVRTGSHPESGAAARSRAVRRSSPSDASLDLT